MSSKARFPAVYLLGVAHCGSTLFGRMLNRHSQVLCAGELLRLDDAMREGMNCGCTAAMTECEHWAKHLPHLEPQHDYDHRHLTPAHLAGMAEREGKSVGLDLSKTRIWREGKDYAKQGAGFIFLVRDSRGILAASQRAGRDLAPRIGRHMKWMKRLDKYASSLGDKAHRVSYEELCAEPERVLRGVCTFLSIEFEQPILEPWGAGNHFVHSSASPFMKAKSLRNDQRWKQELDAETIRTIEKSMSKLPLLRDAYL